MLLLISITRCNDYNNNNKYNNCNNKSNKGTNDNENNSNPSDAYLRPPRLTNSAPRGIRNLPASYQFEPRFVCLAGYRPTW